MDLKRALEAATAQIDKLSDVRAQADRHALTAAQSAGYYTATITALIATMDTVARHNTDAGIAKRAAAYQTFVRAKENAGLERALTNYRRLRRQSRRAGPVPRHSRPDQPARSAARPVSRHG